MRTTLVIDDTIFAAAKAAAAERHLTFGQYVEQALRQSLAAQRAVVPAPSIPVFTRGTGMRQGVDPQSTRALYDALDDSGDVS